MALEVETCTVSEEQTDRTEESTRALYVVNLNPSQKFGSLEEQIFLLAVGVARTGGLLVPVFAQDMDEAHRVRYRQAGLRTEAIDLTSFRWQAYRRLLEIIDRYRIRIVHWNLYSPTNFYTPLLRLVRPTVQHIMTDHNSRPPLFKRVKDPVWKYAAKRLFASAYSGIYAISDYVQGDLRSQAVWRAPGRYHYFVNTDRFRPDGQAGAALRTAMHSDGAFILLVVAQLIPDKGVDVVVRALLSSPPETVLWIIGEGQERENLESLARTLGVLDRVKFLGMRDDVSRYMQAADCFVCPSVWHEAVGLVILEAMACGLPVVASAVGGIPEFVVNKQTGFLFPAGDQEALVGCLKQLRESCALTQQMSMAGRAFALAHFSHTTRIADAMALYETHV